MIKSFEGLPGRDIEVFLSSCGYAFRYDTKSVVQCLGKKLLKIFQKGKIGNFSKSFNKGRES